MGFHGLAGAVYQITLWIARFAFLNILWVIFTLIGLIICGAFPATVAAYHVSRQWVQGKSISIFSEYLSEYKKCFIHANILGWSTAPVFLTVLLALRLAVISQSQYSSIFVMIFSFLFLIISIYIIFLLPVYTHYNVKLGDVYKYAFYLSLSFPHYAIIMLLAWGGVLLGLMYSGFVIFFFASITVYIFMYGSHKAFVMLKRKQELVIER